MHPPASQRVVCVTPVAGYRFAPAARRDCLRRFLPQCSVFFGWTSGNAVCRLTAGQGDRARERGILDSRRDALDPHRDRPAHCWVCLWAFTPIGGTARDWLGRCRTAGRVSTPVRFRNDPPEAL